MGFTFKDQYDARDLIEIVRLLRAPGGCPWDREQTHQSIRMNFIEETYEAVEAIDQQDAALLQEELGDVLLQIALHAAMEEEAGRSSFAQVCDGICKKLIYRHPHVFGGQQAKDSAQVLERWEELKKKEKHQDTAASTLDAVPVTLPGAMRAAKLQKRAAGYGLGWQGLPQAVQSVQQAAGALEKAPAPQRAQAARQLLFAAVGAARLAGVDPELALTQACVQLCDWLGRADAQAAPAGGLGSLDAPQQQALWQQVTMFPDGGNP